MAEETEIRDWALSIGGNRVKTKNIKEIRSPYDDRLIARVCQAGPDEMRDAVGAAEGAFPALRDMPVYRRSEILEKIRDGIRGRYGEIVRTVALESGKPVVYARIEVTRAVSTFDLASKYVMTREGEILSTDIVKYGENRVTFVRRFPRGPIAAITPYNWPINLVAHKVAPAIAVGNPVVLRPASQTPLSAHILAEIVQEAGLPDGGLNVVPSPVAQAGQLIDDQRIKMITFTGSPEVGWGIKEKAGTRQVALELGGNAAVVVEADADLDFAVRRIAVGAFHYAGQNCISVQRIYVHREIRQEFEERLVDVIRKEIKAGDPMEEDVVVGPLITSGDADRVMEWISEAVKGGAKVIVGGERQRNVVEATVLADVDPGMKVSCREVFGPVTTLGTFSEFDEALAMANDPNYGIHAGVFTRDIGKAFRAFRELEVGGVIINDYPTFRVDNIPYGGVKQSGFGREGVKYAMEEMTELKHMTVRLG